MRRIWLLVALSVAGFGLLVFGILLLHPIYVNVCEAAQAGATEKCEPNNLLYIAFLETMHGMTHAEFWTALATIFIAAFTFTLKRSTDKLWETNKEQIRLAREDFLSTHRPEIRFKHVWLVSEFMHDTPIVGQVTCVNSGTSDANIFEYGMNFFVVKHGRSLPIPSQFKNIKKGYVRLPSGVSFPFPDVTYTLTEADEVAVRNGDSKFFFAGYVHYADGIGRVRTTAFCRVMPQPGSSEDTGRLTVYNDPDYEYAD